MSDGVWISLIGALAAIVSAWLARDAKKASRAQEQAVAEIRHEVKNSHTTNLRDDVDGKHKEVVGEVRAMASAVHALAAGQERLALSVGGLHEDVRLLHQADGRQSDSVARLRAEIPTQIEAAIQACRHRDVQG